VGDAANAASQKSTKEERGMQDDERCCGTGTCIINAEGVCWCGQKWDGEKMCFPHDENPPNSSGAESGGDAPPLQKS